MLKGNIISAIQAPFSAASGTLVAVQVALPQVVPASGLILGALDELDSVQYFLQTGAGVTAGAVSVQLLLLSPAGSPNWQTATTPNSATGAVFTLVATLGATATYNGSLNVAGSIFAPSLGIRLAVSGLTGGSITAAQLNCTLR